MTIQERLAKVELLLENHLQHHEKLERYLLLPFLVGMLLLLLKAGVDIFLGR